MGIPEGVEGPRLWQKGCPEHRPAWLPTAPVWSREKRENIDYCVVNELAAPLWAVNLGSIELHTSLHLASDLHRPTVIAFDLDPGEGRNIIDCCEVAFRLRELFAAVKLAVYPKTSGSKGLQIQVLLNTETSHRATMPLSRRVAELLEKQTPEVVVSRMPSRCAGRVLIDWSQNTEHKSMVCAYSARPRSVPRYRRRSRGPRLSRRSTPNSQPHPVARLPGDPRLMSVAATPRAHAL